MDKVKRIKELTQKLNQYRDSYYNDSVSEISDHEYDELFDELKQLEEETNIVMANSPTHTVGYEVKSKLEKVKHSHPMLSLDKTKSVDDLKKFAGDKNCLLMCKMDGLTVLLTYENGELIQAETRGNGEEGEIITHNARVFENIPAHIDYTGHLEVEGEAIITYGDFEIINSKLLENEKYKNTRNLVSGSVRQLDSNIAAQRHIKFITWKVPNIEDKIKSDNSILFRLNYIKDLGFDIVPFYSYTNCSSDKENINNMIISLQDRAKYLGYPIDGLVVTYDDISYGESLGTTGHHPKHSLAYKFYDDIYPTRLLDVEFTMGKTGVLTPTAVFEPVEIDGTMVERASLHNISIMKSLGIVSKYQEIGVYKANMIIPQIEYAEKMDCVAVEEVIDIPTICPICGSKAEIIKDNDTEILICTNSACKGKLLGKLSHFVSKNAINIDGLSEQTLQKFINLGWLNSFRDIYYLSEYKKEMYKLDGFGKKSVDKLIESIEKSRNTTLDRFIYGLCIPLIGRTASKEIAKSCANGNVGQFITIMSLEGNQPFIGLDGFGKEMCNSIVHWWIYNKQNFYELIEEFNFRESVNNGNVKQVLEDKIFVITGSLKFYKNRDELVNVIERNGGKVSGSVSAKTSYLINNDVASTSGKNKKAHDLGIPIISENEFIQIITS
ncbi:NAD-dependent DNA ligase LigA [Romboutsia ilealis]|uniref:NAD-dependent DNA ligase LigA n=1 Tax=Romboutsia ilealis TaxID=1115758 RepID=UPI0026F38809|nr:NAD-dependent DNA ligase LigA [Romboutsia ilealis]